MSNIDVEPGDLLIYVVKKTKKRNPATTKYGRKDIVLVLEQISEREAVILMETGEIGRFVLRVNDEHHGRNQWNWTMSDWERM